MTDSPQELTKEEIQSIKETAERSTYVDSPWVEDLIFMLESRDLQISTLTKRVEELREALVEAKAEIGALWSETQKQKGGIGSFDRFWDLYEKNSEVLRKINAALRETEKPGQ